MAERGEKNTPFEKSADALLDYQVNWARWLPAGDTIVSSEWAVPEGITKDSDTHDGSATTIWLSGGTVGTKYALVNQIATAQDRTDERTIYVKVK